MKRSISGVAMLCSAIAFIACNRSNENTETTPSAGVTAPQGPTETGAAEEDRETGGQTPSSTGSTDNDSTSDSPGGPGSGPATSAPGSYLEEGGGGGGGKGSGGRSGKLLAVDDRRFIAMNFDTLQGSGGSWGSSGGRSGTGGSRSGPVGGQGGAAR